MCIPFVTDAQNTMSVLNHLHQVSKGETLYGIARKYNITEQELMSANPKIPQNGKIKKGDYLTIPQPATAPKSEVATEEATKKQTTSNIKVGVVLPFEEKSDRSKKMIEFYQGFLMAADSVKKEGISLDIYTYSSGTTEAELMDVLMNPEMRTLDVLFGPVDEQQLPATISFCRLNNIKLVLPFTNGQSISGNPHLYIACPNNTVSTAEAASLVIRAFANKNYIILKSNNENSKGSLFTQTLSDMLRKQGYNVQVLNINSDESAYETAMNQLKDNVIIPDNTSIKTLNILISNLDSFRQNHPTYNISLLGYPEWQTYTNTLLNSFFTFDTYIYSTYYYNALAMNTKTFEQAFTKNFGKPMAVNYPRYAMMGFDLAYYFLHEIQSNGSIIVNQHVPYQNMYRFIQEEDNGGYSNRFIQLIHFTKSKQIELIR
ncbi:MAG: LysM peptidoglycan-binding domain-containing protein [Bacteroidaceae bacterium]|nr:LysM peptidoglycan-binding domain-containing protein [Bacteroidaceae bacterium]